MTRFVLTPAAEEDLREIAEYLREESPRAAWKVLGDIRESIRQLTGNPFLGHKRADLADERVRFWSVYSYLVVYLPDT